MTNVRATSEELERLRNLGPTLADNKAFVTEAGIDATCEVDNLLLTYDLIVADGLEVADNGTIMCWRPKFVQVLAFSDFPGDWDGCYELCYQHSDEVMRNLAKQGREKP